MPATGKNTQLYQGRDWASYRPSVAEAFTAIERLHDLTLSQGWIEDPEQGALAFAADLMGLCEELDFHLKLVYADILGEAPTDTSLPQRWIALEMEAHLKELSAAASSLWQEEGARGFAPLILLATTLKTLLKRMDQ